MIDLAAHNIPEGIARNPAADSIKEDTVRSLAAGSIQEGIANTVRPLDPRGNNLVGNTEEGILGEGTRPRHTVVADPVCTDCIVVAIAGIEDIVDARKQFGLGGVLVLAEPVDPVG